jgi:hypothetical protein
MPARLTWYPLSMIEDPTTIEDLQGLLEALDGSPEGLAHFQKAVRDKATILHQHDDSLAVGPLEVLTVLYLVPALTPNALDTLLGRPCSEDAVALVDLGFVSR